MIPQLALSEMRVKDCPGVTLMGDAEPSTVCDEVVATDTVFVPVFLTV
jgi:hypothetical protein